MPRLSSSIAILLLALACATLQSRKTENLLEAAGFRTVAANTPEKIQALNTLPAGKIARVDRNGAIYYVYPDTKECRCLRVGREEQYRRYRRMAAESKSNTLDTTGADVDSGVFKGEEPW